MRHTSYTFRYLVSGQVFHNRTSFTSCIDYGTHRHTYSFPSFSSGSSEGPIYISITISAVSAHFLLAAAAVIYTCSGDPSGEGLAFYNFFYKWLIVIAGLLHSFSNVRKYCRARAGDMHFMVVGKTPVVNTSHMQLWHNRAHMGFCHRRTEREIYICSSRLGLIKMRHSDSFVQDFKPDA